MAIVPFKPKHAKDLWPKLVRGFRILRGWDMVGRPFMEFKCPKCGRALLSRRNPLCGYCGEALPKELLLTDEERSAVDKEIDKARRRKREAEEREPEKSGDGGAAVMGFTMLNSGGMGGGS